VLFYLGENLTMRADEIGARLARVVGRKQADSEVARSIERVFSYAAWADKFDGAVHNPPFRNVSMAMNEPIGTVGIVAPSEAPLVGLLSLVLPLIAMGNTVVGIPSEQYPLIVGDLYQLFDTSDLPGGVVNLVSGRTSELTKILAEHDAVDAVWCFADEASSAQVKALSIGNLKQVFTNEGRVIDWFDNRQAEGRWFLQHAVQVKNIWVPYGE
jgi:aldehyde dehydrogenase (NAD+)